MAEIVGIYLALVLKNILLNWNLSKFFIKKKNEKKINIQTKLLNNSFVRFNGVGQFKEQDFFLKKKIIKGGKQNKIPNE